MSVSPKCNDCPRLRLQLLLDNLSALKQESEMELKRRIAMNEESIEMDVEIWSKLPEKPLMVVLSSLPTFIGRDLRVLCKRWQYLLSPAPMFRQISSTLVPSSSPAFFIGDKREKYFPHTLSHSLFLLHSEPLGVYPFSLDFMDPEIGGVLTACKSILCCLSRCVKREPCSYYICNPLTRTWIKLPPLPYPIPRISEFKFHGFAFSSDTRSCILVTGCNNPINGERNNMVMEIYDSDTNEWTLIKMNLPISICPWQEGLYSRGRFYWINITFGEDTADILAFDIAVYNIVGKNWEVIKLPRRSDGLHSDCLFYWNLTGYDGNVIVVDNNDLSLWKLNEEHEGEETYNWLELQLFPKSLHEENAKRLESYFCPNLFDSQVVVNSCGWVLVHLHGYKIVVFNSEGRMVRCIQGNLLKAIAQFVMPMPIYAYEINNVWWP